MKLGFRSIYPETSQFRRKNCAGLASDSGSSISTLLYTCLGDLVPLVLHAIVVLLATVVIKYFSSYLIGLFLGTVVGRSPRQNSWRCLNYSRFVGIVGLLLLELLVKDVLDLIL